MVNPMSIRRMNQRRLFVMANQSQERARLWRVCHSMSESLSTVSNVAIWALVVVPVGVLPASQSFGLCRVHIPAPLLWLVHQKYFFPSNVLTKALSSLPSVSLGGLFFQAHLSVDFFFDASLVFFWSFIFLAAGFFSFLPCWSSLLCPDVLSLTR